MSEAIDRLVESAWRPRAKNCAGSWLGPWRIGRRGRAIPFAIPYADLPGFPGSGVTGHAGEVVAGISAVCRSSSSLGRAHYYEHGDAGVMRPVIETLAGMGITRLILTNAAGSLEPDMPAGLGDADHRSHQFLRHPTR